MPARRGRRYGRAQQRWLQRRLCPSKHTIEQTQFRSVDASIDAVGFEAKGSTVETLLLEHTGNGKLQPEAIVSQHLKLGDAARGYEMFDKEQDECRKVILTP